MAPKSTSLGSNANDAFAKFASMDQFDLVKPKIQPKNPFDDPVPTTSIQPPNGTLAGMKANNTTEKKEVMKSSGNTNALVMSNSQTGNWGGMNYGMGMGSVTQGMGNMTMGGGPPAPQPMMNQGYGYPQQQTQSFGAGGYGYGQPMGNVQQQPMQDANQGPTMQQQPYGQGYQQGYGQPQQF
jgi:hypothetical protein